ncbi:MAG: CPP1-like family protein [Leptolyngbyaceae bacterium]|nr:CPP1-like family protein [Leptolyngbyaceae bacterium]
MAQVILTRYVRFSDNGKYDQIHGSLETLTMSTQNHYETLGVDENSSFEEIQGARDRLLQEFAENKKQSEAVEAAYDAILMNRLRMRQEGKIKVPDQIRFAEKEVEAKASNQSSKQAPAWVSQLMDNPSRNEVLWPAAIFIGTALLGLAAESAGIAVGVIAAVYLLNRKENKFFRSLLLALAALAVGALIGTLVGQAMGLQLQATEGISLISFAGIVTSFFFWLVTSFFK